MADSRTETGIEPRVAALIERIVRDANLPSARAREELRRELISHFDEAADSSASADALRDALDRFGSTEAVSEGFRHAYRRGRLVAYIAKIVAAAALSWVVAIAVLLVLGIGASLGAESTHILSASRGALPFLGMVVCAAIAAWELGIEPLCARLERRPLTLLMAIGGMFVTIFTVHSITDSFVPPGRALVGSGMTIAVWIATIAIIARSDLLFLRWFGAKTRS